VADGGGKASAALNVLDGAHRVAAFLIGSVRKGWRDDWTIRVDMINGMPGLVLIGASGVVQTSAFEFEGDTIKAIYAVRNPDKLKHLDLH
jgi:RNA polymerase sigma-70 factor (ECF subfamily)